MTLEIAVVEQSDITPKNGNNYNSQDGTASQPRVKYGLRKSKGSFLSSFMAKMSASFGKNLNQLGLGG